MKELKDYILSKVHIEANTLQVIMESFESKNYTKDDTIIREGQYVTRYYFVAHGGVRIVIDTPDREITAWLIFENSFFSDLHSLRLDSPSRSKVLAIENTTIYSIDAHKMDEYYRRFAEWQTFGRMMMEDAFLSVIDTLISFQVMDAESRYLQLLEKSEAINRVPLHQLASYLGITPSSLSRIRKNIR